jgi:hypothetical protein
LLSLVGFLGARVFAFREKNERSQEALKSYLDQMSNLILSEEWPSSQMQNSEKIGENKLLTVVRARTIIALRELDKVKHGNIIPFSFRIQSDSCYNT